MKNRFIVLSAIVLSIVLVSGCPAPSTSQSPDSTTDPSTEPPGDSEFTPEGLTLVWYDEFNGDSLDTTKWEAPDNMERQGYSHWMSSQVSLVDGNLRLGIELTEEGANFNYDCGAVRTKRNWTDELFVQTYGYFEARMKLPANISADYWAAFWMMSGDVSDGQSDTQQGHEIDIMESFTIANGGQHKLTMHWNGYDANHSAWSLDCGTHTELADGEFHVYGFYWDQDKFISYVDGVEVGRTDFIIAVDDLDDGTTAANGPSRQPGYIKLSCEAAAWPGAIDGPESPLPQSDEFLVDYVRAYTGQL